MSNRLRRIFSPTPEEKIEDNINNIKLFAPIYEKRGCSTCANRKHVVNYPDFVTGEECECTAGLKCDTVLFSVKNCPGWRDNGLLEKRIGDVMAEIELIKNTVKKDLCVGLIEKIKTDMSRFLYDDWGNTTPEYDVLIGIIKEYCGLEE